jgi:hypothetical protein
MIGPDRGRLNLLDGGSRRGNEIPASVRLPGPGPGPPGRVVRDVTVVDRDLFRAPPEDLLKVKVRMTLIDGESVYESGGP